MKLLSAEGFAKIEKIDSDLLYNTVIPGIKLIEDIKSLEKYGVEYDEKLLETCVAALRSILFDLKSFEELGHHPSVELMETATDAAERVLVLMDD